MDGQKQFIQVDHNDLYPYLLVNIGSGVSMIKVDTADYISYSMIYKYALLSSSNDAFIVSI